MATAVNNTYQVDSGRGVYAGVPNPLLRTVIFVGDSLTEDNYGVCPWYWLLAMLQASLKLVLNCGHSGQSVSGLIDQLELPCVDLTGGPKGLAGLSNVGSAFLRIGTNTGRGAPGSTGVPIAGDTEEQYLIIIDRLLEVAQRVYVFDVPCIDGNTSIQGYNDYLDTLPALYPGRVFRIHDGVDLMDEDGEQIATYFEDTIHFTPAGMYQCALSAVAELEASLTGITYPSQLINDADDIYPATDQWVQNPLNLGTGGTLGTGMTGQLPDDSQAVGTSGSAATFSIEPADGGDPNGTPWIRIEPTTVVNGSISVTMNIDGEAITTSTPAGFEQVVEIRFNAMDGAHITEVNASMQYGAFQVPEPARLRTKGIASPITTTVVLAQAVGKMDDNAGTPPPAYATFNVSSDASFTGPMGSVDYRCYSIRSIN